MDRRWGLTLSRRGSVYSTAARGKDVVSTKDHGTLQVAAAVAEKKDSPPLIPVSYPERGILPVAAGSLRRRPWSEFVEIARTAQSPVGRS